MIKIIRATTVPLSLNTFCKGILKELSEKYEVIGLSSPGEDLDLVGKREGIRTIAVSMERHISLAKDLKSLSKLVGVFRKEKPTMVHSMTPKAGLLCMMAAWLTRVPVRVHTFTGLVFPTATGLKRRILMLTDSITCACATHVIPEGEGVMKDLRNHGITKKPMKVLGYGNIKGVDMTYFSLRPKVLELAQRIRKKDVFTFLFVGRIVKDKGVNELCWSMDRLSGFAPVRLVLIGPCEDDLDPISHASKKIIEDNAVIEYVGEKYGDELLAYYASADCFVLPSYREGFPNTVLEAGAMGLPSIVTDINGSREIIVEGENGVIVPPRNEEALFQAMLEMVRNKSKREYMASQARDLIASRFEQSFVQKCLLDFYEEILKPYK
jgi:glycosyltransferase involved in cell wall biosynthesis